MNDSWHTRTARATAAVLLLMLAACGSDDDPPPAATPSAPAAAASSSATPVSPSPSAAPSPTPSADCVTATLGKLTLAERAGQLLMVGTSVNAPDEVAAAIARQRVGNVFLRGRSTHRAAQLRSDIGALQARSPLPLLVALDQEGGSVQTLKGPDFPRLPSAERLGAGPAATLRETTRAEARKLAAIGVNVNLAPVADTVPASLGRGNPPIGAFRRQYGSDPAKVAAAIRTVVPASQDAGVLTTLKHFPGLGRVRVNTDTTAGATDATTTVDDPYLQPFAAGIEAGSTGVMISSAFYPRLDRSAIAAFSRPVITGLLRERLGFDGLVMSDDLGAAVALSGVPPAQRAVRFVAAGGDLVLTIRPSDAAPMTKGIIEKAEKDQAFRVRVDDATRHVLAAKQRAGVLRCG